MNEPLDISIRVFNYYFRGTGSPAYIYSLVSTRHLLNIRYYV